MKRSSARNLALFACLACLSCGPPTMPDRGATAPLAIGPAAAPGRRLPRASSLRRSPRRTSRCSSGSNDPEQLMHEVVVILPPNAAAAASVLDPVQLASMLLGRRLGTVIDLAQPIDVVSIGTKSEPTFVVSMAVKPDAESTLGEGLVLREEGGLVHIAKPDDSHADAGRMSACAFTAAAGRATTRLVCASDEASLTASAAYLARNVAAEPLDADARLSLPGKILREKRDGTTKAIGDAASARLGAALVERFIDEIDRVDADVRVLGSGIEIGLDLRLSGRESILARAVVPRTKPAPPPAAFYRLPADAIVSLYTTGALAEDLAPLRKVLADDLERTLVQDGHLPDKTHALRERIESLVLTGGPLVFAAGIAGGRDGAEKALAAIDGARAADEARVLGQARSALLPWMMFEVDEPGEKWTQGLRDIVKRGEDVDKTRKPGSKSTTPVDPDGDHVDVKVGALDPALKLPKDTLHLEVLLTPRTKGKRPTRKGHLFVVPRGAATWLGYSEDAAAVASRLRLAIDDTSEAGTLARSTAAATLRARPAVGRRPRLAERAALPGREHHHHGGPACRREERGARVRCPAAWSRHDRVVPRRRCDARLRRMSRSARRSRVRRRPTCCARWGSDPRFRSRPARPRAQGAMPTYARARITPRSMSGSIRATKPACRSRATNGSAAYPLQTAEEPTRAQRFPRAGERGVGVEPRVGAEARPLGPLSTSSRIAASPFSRAITSATSSCDELDARVIESAADEVRGLVARELDDGRELLDDDDAAVRAGAHRARHAASRRSRGLRRGRERRRVGSGRSASPPSPASRPNARSVSSAALESRTTLPRTRSSRSPRWRSASVPPASRHVRRLTRACRDVARPRWRRPRGARLDRTAAAARTADHGRTVAAQAAGTVAPSATGTTGRRGIVAKAALRQVGRRSASTAGARLRGLRRRRGGDPGGDFATMTAVTPTKTTNTAAQIAAVAAREVLLAGVGDERSSARAASSTRCAAELNDGVLGCGGGGAVATSAGPRMAMRSSEGVATGPA